MRTGEITKNFTWQEMTASATAVRRGIDNEPHGEAIRNLTRLCRDYLQPLRDHFGPIHINSGYRSAALNKMVGGAANSWHKEGTAADIRLPSVLKGVQMMAFVHQRFVDEGIGYDELLLSRRGQSLWLHIAFNPDAARNRMRVAVSIY